MIYFLSYYLTSKVSAIFCDICDRAMYEDYLWFWVATDGLGIATSSLRICKVKRRPEKPEFGYTWIVRITAGSATDIRQNDNKRLREICECNTHRLSMRSGGTKSEYKIIGQWLTYIRSKKVFCVKLTFFQHIIYNDFWVQRKVIKSPN